MIDIDKVKAAWISQPLCQNDFVKTAESGRPAMLCAISALLTYAGVSVDLLKQMDDHDTVYPDEIAAPILRVVYGIPASLDTDEIIQVFDGARNEAEGCAALIRTFEMLNEQERCRTALVSISRQFAAA